MFFFFQSLILSTALYIYLHHKTKISLKFLYLDNLIVIIVSAGLINIIHPSLLSKPVLAFILNLFMVFSFVLTGTLLRFYRTPIRKTNAKDSDIISPADGRVIYIKEIKSHEVPFSVKNKRVSMLQELTKTNIIEDPSWLIGINMTPFDVHKNCAPISGEIILSHHFHGKFLSLKKGESETENERRTTVFQKEDLLVAVVQIASRRVKRILAYVKDGEHVQRGHWYGMITFGSQVDIVLPIRFSLKIELGQQVYAGKTIIAEES